MATEKIFQYAVYVQIAGVKYLYADDVVKPGTVRKEKHSSPILVFFGTRLRSSRPY